MPGLTGGDWKRAAYGTAPVPDPPISLADQGDLGVAGASGAFVEPPGAGLVAAGPCVPVDDEPPGQSAGGEGGEQSLDLRDGQRDHAGFPRWRLAGPGGGRCLGVGAVLEAGGGDGADGQWRAIAV
jgi:hypothetical protein